MKLIIIPTLTKILAVILISVSIAANPGGTDYDK